MAASASAPPRLVQSRMKQHGIHVTLEWVEACIDWLAGEQQDGQPPSLEQVIEAVEEQYLSTNILDQGVMERPVLPNNLEATRSTTLPGNLVLMVEKTLDVGNPAYGQLQKLHKVDTENARVGGEETDATQTGYQATQGGRFAAAWEPKPSRALYISLTDGFNTVKGLEVEPLSKMPDWPRPGVKIQLKGPLECRRGVILLRKDNCIILGGGSKELQEENTPRKVLESRIGREDVGQENPFASVPLPGRRDVVQQQNSQQPLQHRQVFPQLPQHEQVHQQPGQHVDQVSGVEEDFPDDDDLSQFAVDGPTNQDPTPDNDFPDDDDDNFLVAASQEISHSSTSSIYNSSNVVDPTLRPLTYNSFNTPSTSETRASTSTNHSVMPGSSIPVASMSPAYSSRVEKSQAAPVLSNTPQVIGRDPWTYISLLLPLIQAGTPFKAKLKVVSATLASKISLKKSSAGPVWNLTIVINDGSGALTVPLSPSLLDSHLGPAVAYSSAVKEEFKQKSKALSKMLASLSALLTLESSRADPGTNKFTATVISIEEVTGLHLAQMRKRRTAS